MWRTIIAVNGEGKICVQERNHFALNVFLHVLRIRVLELFDRYLLPFIKSFVHVSIVSFIPTMS